MKESLNFWIRKTQAFHETSEKFIEEEERLGLVKDPDGIYRCQGRIYGHNPIFLPSKAEFSKKLAASAHLRTLHGGVGYTMAEVRRDYWIPRLRQLVKKVMFECHGCKRFYAVPYPMPPPGGLPRDRTEGDRPFQVIGLDYAGPVYYKKSSKTVGKSYILLYCCSLTRAVYLDLMPNQTFEELIISFKRFIARRGRPEKIYSDNAQTFQAGDKWLRKVMREEKIHDFLAQHHMYWQFNTSLAPWWGGQYERIVGLVKQSLYKVVGRSTLSWKELESVLLDVEVTVNNRPLGYVEDDMTPILTPSSMMMLDSNFIPEGEPDCDDVDLVKRAKYLRRCKDNVWKRWTTEYVRALRERHNLKHKSKELKVKVGDVVLIRGDEKNRAHWKTGIVSELIPGRDGIIRVVRLRAGKSHLERAVQHLYPLEITCDSVKPTASSESAALNPSAAEFQPQPPQRRPQRRPQRSAAESARRQIREQMSAIEEVPEIEL